MPEAVIHWWNQKTTARGHGQPIDSELAHEWLRYLKEKWPDLEHSVLPGPPGRPYPKEGERHA